MRRLAPLALIAASLTVLCACTADEPPPASDGAGAGVASEGDVPARAWVSPDEPSLFAPGGPLTDAQLGDHHVVLSCAVDGEDVGSMTFALWPDRAPITVRNFMRLCDEGFYDGLSFHRVMRDFMVQGGDPLGIGSGGSPYGMITGEFSDAPERAHGYGVIAMARSNSPDSASCQFFVCCDDGPSAWGLDGKYASFGRLTSGVATLEALAEVPVKMSAGGEMAAPLKPVVITRAEVRPGPAPTGETIARPAPDLGDEARTVVVQHVLVSFRGIPELNATRSQDEARELAVEILERARAGEDFDALVREYTSDAVQEGDETPGHYKLHNRGVRDPKMERALFDLGREIQAEQQQLSRQIATGELSQEAALARMRELGAPYMKLQQEAGFARDGMVKGFGDLAFALAVGEIGVAEYDAEDSPFGWHVIQRIE